MCLSRVLPFDDEDDREIARQTIYMAPDFSFSPWEKITSEAKDIVEKLLEKNRHKRPNLESVLEHPWFASYKDILDMRKNVTSNQNKFMAFSIAEPGSPTLKKEGVHMWDYYYFLKSKNY